MARRTPACEWEEEDLVKCACCGELFFTHLHFTGMYLDPCLRCPSTKCLRPRWFAHSEWVPRASDIEASEAMLAYYFLEEREGYLYLREGYRALPLTWRERYLGRHIKHFVAHCKRGNICLVRPGDRGTNLLRHWVRHHNMARFSEGARRSFLIEETENKMLGLRVVDTFLKRFTLPSLNSTEQAADFAAAVKQFPEEARTLKERRGTLHPCPSP
jgi:hypothetical protein